MRFVAAIVFVFIKIQYQIKITLTYEQIIALEGRVNSQKNFGRKLGPSSVGAYNIFRFSFNVKDDKSPFISRLKIKN